MQGNKYDHPVQLTRSWFGGAFTASTSTGRLGNPRPPREPGRRFSGPVCVNFWLRWHGPCRGPVARCREMLGGVPSISESCNEYWPGGPLNEGRANRPGALWRKHRPHTRALHRRPSRGPGRSGRTRPPPGPRPRHPQCRCLGRAHHRAGEVRFTAYAPSLAG